MKKMLISKKWLPAMVFSTILFTGCVKDFEAPAESDEISTLANGNATVEQADAFVPNEILVKFKEGTSADAKSFAFGRIKGKVKEKIFTKSMERFGRKEAIHLVHGPAAVLEMIAALKGLPELEYAEPNYIYTHDVTSNDTYYTNGSLWGMYGDATTPANQFGSQAGEAWAAGKSGSASVVVGVIDEGIQFTHPDLNGQVWTNPYDLADGVDNDGNGYVDDIHGWDFDGKNNSVYDGGTKGSLDDHGTHVSGTIGGKGNNGAGVAGVCWNVTIISCKFLGRRGGTTANAVKAVDYLNDLKTRHGMNIVASNNSWGGGGFSQSLYDAIARANAKNILFVAAAGNGGSDGVGDNNDVTASYPSNYDLDNIIAVAAITSSGGLSTFSNYGATKVDLGAPGQGVWSTTAFNIYSSYSGTSMATPHVTGGVALYASSNPTADATAIKAAVLGSTVPTASLAGKCVTGGRLNVSGY